MLLANTQSAAQQPVSTFNHRFHFGYPAAVLNNLIVTDSCYYASGIVADSVFPYKTGNIFVKFDLEGQVDFFKTITSTTKTYQVWYASLLALEDGFITAGYYSDSVLHSLVIRYDLNSDTLWTKTYKNEYYPDERFIVSHDIIKTTGNGFLILNTETGEGEGYEMISLRKIDERGNQIWYKSIYDSDYQDGGLQAYLMPDAGFLILGQKYNVVGTHGFNIQAVLIKTDSLGNEEWTYEFISDDEIITAYEMVVHEEDSTIVLAGEKGLEVVSPPYNKLYFNGFVFKIDMAGNILWQTDIRHSIYAEEVRFNRIIEATDKSGYLLAGKYWFGPTGYDWNGWIAKVSPQGDSLWSRSVHYVESIEALHELNYIVPTADGGYLLCGRAADLGSPTVSEPRHQAWLLKVDEHGCLVPGCHLLSDTEEVFSPIDDDPFLIYPNPASELLNIYVAGNKADSFFQISDALGNVVTSFRSATPNTTHIVDVAGWAKGTYYLSCLADNKLVASKAFVVQ